MDKSEEIVEKLLKSMGFQDVIYEPNGNVTPDFLVDGRVAVEVRQLNKSVDSGSGNRKGLQETSTPLWQGIEKLGRSFGNTVDETWFLIIRFSRPIRAWKHLKPNVKKALHNFKEQSTRNNGVIYEGSNFELRVMRSMTPLSHFFNMGMMNDRQAAGFLVADMIDNINYCCSEKAQLTSKYKKLYPEWWLVLTNYFLVFPNDDEVQILRNRVDDEHHKFWDRIILVDRHNHEKWFELSRSSFKNNANDMVAQTNEQPFI